MAKANAAAESEAIGVFARLKPLTPDSGSVRGEVQVNKRFNKQKSVQMRNLEFSLDWIFDTEESQEDVYAIAAHDRVSAVLQGFNSTILAYGQTGSGKTHTMMGPDEVLTDFINSEVAQHGIVPRASEHVFEGLRHGPQDSSYIVQCSYLEIYNNTLNDLLGGKQNMPMRETPGKGLLVEGLSYEQVSSSQEVMASLARGNSKRVVAAMKMNARSSRGHAIFTIYVKEILAFGGERAGKLNLVDLAGMESSKKSYAVEGASNNEMRKVEAKNINTSLYALGTVIERLSEAGRGAKGKTRTCPTATRSSRGCSRTRSAATPSARSSSRCASSSPTSRSRSTRCGSRSAPRRSRRSSRTTRSRSRTRTSCSRRSTRWPSSSTPPS